MKILNNEKNSEDSSRLSSHIKAILVINEKKDVIDKAHKEYIDYLLTKNRQEIDLELLNLSIADYKKDRDYFYPIILRLVKKDELCRRLAFRRLSPKDQMEETRVFELIGHSKDSELETINEILMLLVRYPHRFHDTLDLCYYWINKGYYNDLKHIDWVLEELAKKNNGFVGEFFDTCFNKIEEKNYIFITFIIKDIGQYDLDTTIDRTMKIQTDSVIKEIIWHQLLGAILGFCYNDSTKLGQVQKFSKLLIERAKGKKYIKTGIPANLLDASKLNDDEYRVLIDKVAKLIEGIRIGQEEYDFVAIEKNLSKYPTIEPLFKDILIECKNGKYSPLLWMLEKEEPSSDDVQFKENESELSKALKFEALRSTFWPRAYLTELNQGLSVFMSVENDRRNSKEKEKEIKDKFMDDDGFWRFFSELMIMKRLGAKNIITKDKVIGTKDIDIEAKLGEKTVLFEITTPDQDRDLKLSNRSVGLGNKSESVLSKKNTQLLVGLAKSSRENSTPYYVVMNVSGSTIDEYDLFNTLFGQLKIPIHSGEPFRDGRTSIQMKKKDKLLISGVVYFKQKLVIDGDRTPRIQLIGDVINTPNARNALNEGEVAKLKGLLFA